MDDAALRDRLAVERTHLANERTLLAYIRTALALAAGGAALLQFFPARDGLQQVAWALVIAGGVMALLGIYRFVAVRARLRGPGAA